jgi:protein-disulfide isomerase
VNGRALIALLAALALAGGLILLRGRARPAAGSGAERPVVSSESSGRAVPSGSVEVGSPARALPPSSDETIWKVPVYADDPVLGPKDALVTVVEFSEFESEMCKRAAGTMAALIAAYPKDVRVVWKDSPLPFDLHARPAALLGRLAYELRGPSGFWQVHDLLFANQPHLADDDLRAVAQKLSFVWDPAATPSESKALRKIDQSIVLGGDVKARGIPHFFINGVRLAGSQPLAQFRSLVDRELAKARARVAGGVAPAQVYDAILREGREPMPLITRDVPPAGADSPSRGAVTAAVVIQQFADFPCQTCEHAAQTLADLEREYGERLRVVWRYLPTAADKEALAAQAGEEVFVQAGAAAFWLFHERVLDASEHGLALDRSRLERIATETGVNADKVRAALRSQKHLRRIKEDWALATKLGLGPGPAYAIGTYFFATEQPGPVLKKAIAGVLGERLFD